MIRALALVLIPVLGLAWSPLAQAGPAPELSGTQSDLSGDTPALSAETSAETASSDRAPAQAPPTARPGVLPGLLAIVPGLVVPGLGHRVAKDRRTASKLLRIGGAGWLTVLAGVGVIAGSGASRRVSPGLIPLVGTAGGVALMTWSADIYGAFGGAGIGGEPSLSLPRLTVRAGYLFVEDPQFPYDHFADLAATAAFGAWRGMGAVQLDPGAENYRARLGGIYRASGWRRGDAAATGSFLDVHAALIYHHFGSEDFALITGELAATGRYDLVTLAPSLAGSFAELTLGLSAVITDYQVADAGVDRSEQMLLRFGYGVYIGQRGGIQGEARIFYDHRRDDFAGGLAVTSGNNGFIGSFGVDANVFFSRSLGVGARFQIGSAYVAGLALLYRVE